MSSKYRQGDRIIVGATVQELSFEEAENLNAGGRLVALEEKMIALDPQLVARCDEAVSRSRVAFENMAMNSDEAITCFFEILARRLEDDTTFSRIMEVNETDVLMARQRGRAIGRLEITPKMRSDMIESARMWASSTARKESILERIDHVGWSVEKVASPLGVVAFVFEGRPNVCVDATGVLRTGNTCVFRIGSDAIGTARAVMDQCVTPALIEAGLPKDSVVLLDEADRSAGFALFSDRRISLAVARGSGTAVSDLGFVAQANGIPASLHGTGGAWMIASDAAETERFAVSLRHSLDRKVCNTVNVCCIPSSRSRELVPIVAEILDAIGRSKDHRCTVHAVGLDESEMDILNREFVKANQGNKEDLQVEWEWDLAPEMFLVKTKSLEESFSLCNQFSPQFVVSVLSEDAADLEMAWEVLNAPFVGNGFTRWVDGQYALGKPELGLSNWQSGRSLARGGILSGDDIRTFRYRMLQDDPNLHR